MTAYSTRATASFIAVLAVGVIVALVFLAGGVRDAFEMVSDHLEAATAQEDLVEAGGDTGVDGVGGSAADGVEARFEPSSTEPLATHGV